MISLVQDYLGRDATYCFEFFFFFFFVGTAIVVQVERLVLTNQSNRIECTVVNSPFAELSLWHHEKLLLEARKTHLEYLLPPYQFGQFTCKFTGGSNSSLVREKGRNSSIMILYVKIHSSTTTILYFCCRFEV